MHKKWRKVSIIDDKVSLNRFFYVHVHNLFVLHFKCRIDFEDFSRDVPKYLARLKEKAPTVSILNFFIL